MSYGDPGDALRDIPVHVFEAEVADPRPVITKSLETVASRTLPAVPSAITVQSVGLLLPDVGMPGRVTMLDAQVPAPPVAVD
ncbi:hypothetical protein [Streptomyces sp. NPDC046261]|uniref:hypothetical protein n=1 Tax=Streptomyces sp. NPDC046261 TaxID=3157200 RepID=UPI0033D47A6D